MEAVTGQTAGGVAFVGGLGAASALVCVPGLSILVFANKDNIVVLGGLINKTAIGKGGTFFCIFLREISRVVNLEIRHSP